MPKITMSIEEYTSFDPVCARPDMLVEEVVKLLHKHRFRHLPVVDGNKAIGIISDRDILVARPLGALEGMRARDVMTKDPYSVSIDASLEAVALELSRRKFGSAMVYDRQNKFCGIFTATDALNALVEIMRGE